MIIEYIKDDILNTHIESIAHGVNCQNKMGSGVAKALYSKFPEIKRSYHSYCDTFDKSEDMLGLVDPVFLNKYTVFNCFTQHNYGYDNQKYVSYEAIIMCFKELNERLKGSSLAIPKIGAGLAGGNWHVIEALINEVTPDIKIYVYYIQ